MQHFLKKYEFLKPLELYLLLTYSNEIINISTQQYRDFNKIIEFKNTIFKMLSQTVSASFSTITQLHSTCESHFELAYTTVALLVFHENLNRSALKFKSKYSQHVGNEFKNASQFKYPAINRKRWLDKVRRYRNFNEVNTDGYIYFYVFEQQP